MIKSNVWLTDLALEEIQRKLCQSIRDYCPWHFGKSSAVFNEQELSNSTVIDTSETVGEVEENSVGE